MGALMLKPVPLIVLASLVLGIASPFVAGLVGLPHADAGWNVAQVWFFAMPKLAYGWLLPNANNMFALAVGVFMLQYLALFAVLLALARLVQRVAGVEATSTQFQSGSGTAFDKAADLYHSKDNW
jgi:hypothetical protein